MHTYMYHNEWHYGSLVTFVPSAQPPRKQLLKVEVLGVPASDSPLLIKYPDFPLSSEYPWPSCYLNRSNRALKVSEDGSLIHSGVQAPGLPTQGEAAGEDERYSACRSDSEGEGIPSVPRKHFRAQCEEEGYKRQGG